MYKLLLLLVKQTHYNEMYKLSAILAFCSFLLNSGPLFAQQKLNLDFEKASVEGPARPWGWSVYNWGAVQFEMDSSVAKKGKYSLSAKCGNGDCAIQSFSHPIEAFAFLEKEVVLRGFIKIEDPQAKAGLSLGYKTWNQDKQEFTDYDTTSLFLKEEAGWQELELNLAIPKNAQSLFVNVNYQVSGQVFFDDLKLICEGKQIEEAQVGNAFSKAQIRKLSRQIIPMSSHLPETANDDPLLNEQLKTMIGDSRLVALGEATHGTSEFFQLKHQVLRRLVQDFGFRVFAIEDNQVAVEAVNDYILNGKGTGRESIRGMFAVWNTQEVLHMIEWMRSYNETHSDDPLYFVGFDMQEFKRPYEALMAFLKDEDLMPYQDCQRLLEDLKDRHQQSFSLADSVKLKWMNQAKEVHRLVAGQARDLIEKAESIEEKVAVQEGIHYSRLIAQYAENLYRGHWSLYRDQAMADNVMWLLEQRFPDEKIMLWAHDVHISKAQHSNPNWNLHQSLSMGRFIAERYPAYKAFGIATYQGAYLAQKSYTDFTKIHCPLYPGPEGSLDEALHQVSLKKGQNSFFLPFFKHEKWLNQVVAHRFANHVSIDYGYWQRISVPYQFDGLFFIDQTGPASYIPK